MKKGIMDLPALNIHRVKVTLVGDDILVTNRFHQTTQDQIEQRQTQEPQSGGGKKARAPKEPKQLFLRAAHEMPGTTPILHDEDPENVWAEGRFGFPSVGIKACAVSAANLCGLQKTSVRQF